MGQKTNPIGNRLGIIRGWDSNWFGGNDYGDRIAEDYKIRRYLEARLSKGGISRIYIERTLKLVTVTITTARPGLIIGKGGQEVDKLKEGVRPAHTARPARPWRGPAGSAARSRPASRRAAARTKPFRAPVPGPARSAPCLQTPSVPA